MYVKLLAGYGLVFVLLIGYLVYLNRRVGRLESRLQDRDR